MPYPENINLPFNFASVKEHFSFCKTLTNIQQDTGISIILSGGNVVIRKEGERYSIPRFENLPEIIKPNKEPVKFGVWDNIPVAVYSLPASVELPDNFIREPFNSNGDNLDDATLTLAGIGSSVLNWQRSSQFCSRCGASTEPLDDSFGKRCTECGAQHFPHIHPCAIVLVKRGDDILLTRKKEWSVGRYGLVAGFVDMGESLEECAIREVMEETGIAIKNVRYVASQNWPFPAQLMAGFLAEYESGDIAVDYKELEDAKWFNKKNLPELPGKRSIARWIIDNHAS